MYRNLRTIGGSIYLHCGEAEMYIFSYVNQGSDTWNHIPIKYRLII